MVEPTIFNITIGSWASIFVALTTLVLAIITYLTVRHMKKQMVFIRKQTLLQVAELSPILKIESFKIVNDELVLNIKNIGRGSAHRIGIYSIFHAANPIVESYDKDTNISMVRFSYNPKPIIDTFENESNKIVKNGCVNFISKSLNRIIILKPDESAAFRIQPEFNVRYKFTLEGLAGRTIKLSELIELMKNNSVEFFGLSFDIICKNVIEDVQESVRLTKFVFDIKNHKTLEDAHKQNLHMDFTPLTQNDMEIQMGHVDYEQYSNMKSPRNYIPEDNEHEFSDIIDFISRK